MSKKFITSWWPWLLGGGALLVYLLTLAHGATLQSAELVPQVAGWNWHPVMDQPISHLIWRPFALLPATVMVWALNVFNAGCAALVLVCLARIVVLFPQDRNIAQWRTGDDPQALLQSSWNWLPPLLAVLALGLQISFWEQATSLSSKMPALLLLAYALRCLAEYRLERRQQWLSRAALFYGLGMSESWALAGLVPLFAMVVIWVNWEGFCTFQNIERVKRGRDLHRLFNFKFLWRTAAWGLAGFSLYLLPPLWQSHAQVSAGSFWLQLREVLHLHKECLLILYYYLQSSHGMALLICTGLLPLVPLGLRWRELLNPMETALIHVVHLVLLLVSGWLMFSPTISPRVLIPKMAFLPYYFCCALAIGFYAGYFLQLCRPGDAPQSRPAGNLIRFLRKAVIMGLFLLLMLVAVGLPARNWPQIYLTNHLLGNFIGRVAAALPPKPLTLGSDDANLLSVVQTGLAFRNDRANILYFNSAAANSYIYQATEYRRHPQRWPDSLAGKTNVIQFSPQELKQFYGQLVAREPVYFLHPPFGWHSEVTYWIPQGLVWQAVPYTDSQSFAPAPNAEVIRFNQSFWQDLNQSMLPVLTQAMAVEKAGRIDLRPTGWMFRLRLKPLSNQTVEFLAAYYARAADAWGVELQKTGQWEPAAACFATAMALDPNNAVAVVNAHYNAQHGQNLSLPKPAEDALADSLAKFNRWDELRQQCGPVDFPLLLALEADGFAANGSFRQSAADFYRISQLMPNNINAQFALAEAYCNLRQPVPALQVVDRVKAALNASGANSTNQLRLEQIEVRAFLLSGDTNRVLALCRQMVAREPNNVSVHLMAVEYCVRAGLAAQALRWLDAWEGQMPTVVLQSMRGWTLMQLRRFDEAANAFTQALAGEPDNVDWQIARAQSLFLAGHYQQASAEFSAVLAQNPQDYRCQYGLAEAAQAAGQTNEAILHWQTFLKLAPAELPETRLAREQLAAIHLK